MDFVQCLFAAIARDTPACACTFQMNFGRRPDANGLAVDADLPGAAGFSQREAGEIARRDFVSLPAVESLGVHLGALVMLLERVERDPIIPVVAGRVGEEADVIRRDAAAVAVLLQERI